MGAKIHTCPLREQYMFSTHCTITTCKYHSSQTQRRCLSLDVRFAASDKVSDSELKLYKFPELSMQKIAQLRKTTVARVENIVRLYALIQKIEHEPRTAWKYEPSPIIDTFLARRPLTNKRLGFEPWMLPYLCDRDYVVKHAGVEPHELLWMKESEFHSIANLIRSQQ
jgi:hypothetical protein